MPKKVLIVGAAVVAAIVLLLILRRKANAASMPGTAVGAPMTPQAALATLTTTPPRELAAAGVAAGLGYVAGQIRGDGQAVIPQNTARPVGTTYGGAACPEGSYVDPETGKCGSNRFASVANSAAGRAVAGANYSPAAGYYG